jgi:hypothetical protein
MRYANATVVRRWRMKMVGGALVLLVLTAGATYGLLVSAATLLVGRPRGSGLPPPLSTRRPPFPPIMTSVTRPTPRSIVRPRHPHRPGPIMTSLTRPTTRQRLPFAAPTTPEGSLSLRRRPRQVYPPSASRPPSSPGTRRASRVTRNSRRYLGTRRSSPRGSTLWRQPPCLRGCRQGDGRSRC